MSIEPEGAPSELPANVAATAPRDEKPKWLTADTVPRSFNWGAFLIPVPWCLAHRQRVWAVAAAASPVAAVLGVWLFDAPFSWPPPPQGIPYLVPFLGCPVWLSLMSVSAFVMCVLGPSLSTGVWSLAPWLVPFAVTLYLGCFGNKMAVRERRFEDSWDFRSAQRRWTAWGVVVFLITPALLYLVAFILRVFALVDIIR